MGRGSALKAAVLKAVDVKEAVNYLLADTGQEWDGSSNVSCVFPRRHSSGEDAKPSMSIREKDGGAYCFSCGYKSSSFIALWEELYGVSFVEAMEQIWGEFVEPVVPSKEVERAHASLLGRPIQLAKLRAARGITEATAVRFKLGWQGDRLWIPVANEAGFWVNVRRYDLYKTGNGPKMLSYAKGFGSARLYPLEVLRRGRGPLLLVEGELDAIIGCQEGAACVTTTGGAGTWRQSFSRAMRGRDVVVVPDNDEAGRTAAKERAASLRAVGARALVADLPVKRRGEDLTDFVVKYGGSVLELVAGASTWEGGIDAEAEAAPAAGSFVDLDHSEQEDKMVARANVVLEALKSVGAFFKNDDGAVFFARPSEKLIRVTGGQTAELEGYLWSLNSIINKASSAGRFIIHHVQNAGAREARDAHVGYWSMFVRPDKVFAAAPAGKLLRITREGVAVIDNGFNDDRVYVATPDNSEASAIRLNKRVKPETGLELIWNRVALNIPCRPSQRYLVVCWLLGALCRNYVRARPMIRLSAKTSSGKSAVLKMCSSLIYGREWLISSATTGAASYDVAWTHPVLFFDNIETHNFTPEFNDFLFSASTGGAKLKRRSGQDTGVVETQTNCLVMTNGIEPLRKHEMINRNIEVPLDIDRWGVDKYNEVEVLRAIERDRDAMMSGAVMAFQKHVLPRILDGDLNRIASEIGKHPLSRFNDYIAIMGMFLDIILAFAPNEDFIGRDMLKRWVSYMDEKQSERSQGTDDVLYFVQELVDRGPSNDGVITPIVRSRGGAASFKAPPQQLYSDFLVIAKELGKRIPWENTASLTSRIKDAREVLDKAGWRYSVRTINGRKNHVFERG